MRLVDGGAAGLCPAKQAETAINMRPVAPDFTGGRRQRPVFDRVGGKLVQAEGQRDRGRGGDRDRGAADPGRDYTAARRGCWIEYFSRSLCAALYWRSALNQFRRASSPSPNDVRVSERDSDFGDVWLCRSPPPAFAGLRRGVPSCAPRACMPPSPIALRLREASTIMPRVRIPPRCPGRRRCTWFRGRSGLRGAGVHSSGWRGCGRQWRRWGDRARCRSR